MPINTLLYTLPKLRTLQIVSHQFCKTKFSACFTARLAIHYVYARVNPWTGIHFNLAAKKVRFVCLKIASNGLAQNYESQVEKGTVQNGVGVRVGGVGEGLVSMWL